MGRPPSITNETLIRAAREVFVRDGALGSTKEIAQRAGISEAALFKRYTRKADLFVAAMTPPPVDIDAILARARSLDDPRAAIARIAEDILAYFRFALPMVIPMISNPLIGLEGVRAAFGDNAVAMLAAGVAEYLETEAAAGRITCPSPFPAAGLLVMGAHTLAQFEVMGLHDIPIGPDGVRALTDALWNGLAPKSPGPKEPRS